MSSSKPDLAGEFNRGGINIVQAQVSGKHTSVYSPVNHTAESNVLGRVIKKRRNKQTSSVSQQPCIAAKVLSILFELV
jgi:hypothetical protein